MKGLDFLVIGAAKAGTTTLFEYLRKHPQIAMPAGKEAPFFCDDGMYEKGLPWYLDHHFSRAPHEATWGTITPAYMLGGSYGSDWKGPPEPANPAHDVRTVPERIRECLPEVRIVAILRDPVERAWSHYRMDRWEGWENRSFDEVVMALLEPKVLEEDRQRPGERTYVTRSEYARLLAPYFDCFPRDQIHVEYTARLEQDPSAVLEAIYHFVGVNVVLPDDLNVKFRQGATSRRISWLDPHAWRRSATSNARLKRLWHTAPIEVRRRVSETYSRRSNEIKQWNRKGEASPIPAASAQRLRAHFRSDDDELEKLLGEPPPWRLNDG